MSLPGFDDQAGRGEAAVDQMGPVLDLLQLALDDADQAVQVGGGEVGHGPLEQRPDALGGIKVRRVRGQPADAQPFVVFRGEVRQFRGQVDVEVIPAPHQRRGQLTVGGDAQVPVIAPAEPLGLALAAAGFPQLVKHAPPVAAPVARHAGEAAPPPPPAPHRGSGGLAAPRPSQRLAPARSARGSTGKSGASSLPLPQGATGPAPSSGSLSRRCCSAGVYPPRCAYRIPRSYARKQPTSRPDLYEFTLGSGAARNDLLSSRSPRR